MAIQTFKDKNESFFTRVIRCQFSCESLELAIRGGLLKLSFLWLSVTLGLLIRERARVFDELVPFLHPVDSFEWNLIVETPEELPLCPLGNPRAFQRTQNCHALITVTELGNFSLSSLTVLSSAVTWSSVILWTMVHCCAVSSLQLLGNIQFMTIYFIYEIYTGQHLQLAHF